MRHDIEQQQRDQEENSEKPVPLLESRVLRDSGFTPTSTSGKGNAGRNQQAEPNVRHRKQHQPGGRALES